MVSKKHLYLAIGGVLVVMLALGGLAVWLFFEQQERMQKELEATKQDLGEEQQANKDLTASFESYKGDVNSLLEDYAQRMNELQTSYSEVQADTDRMNAVLATHDLTKLAFEKPGLIETRINRGTEQVFTELEQATRGFDDDATATEE